jgi:hypothetical protein
VTVDVHDAIAPIAAEWDALAERTAAPPFARPGWFAAWGRAFGADEPWKRAWTRDCHERLRVRIYAPTVRVR